MKTVERKTDDSRKSEEGAALIMALLVSFLLIALSTALILATSVNSWNFTDATSEQQAYNAAENGIQTVVDALRYKCTTAVSGATHNGCRVKPSPLYATTDTNGTTIYEDNKLNKITFSKVIQLATSNNGADASTDSRMSRMLGYSGTAANSPLTINTGASAYSAFNLAITDPDNTGSLISYVTQGRFYEHDADSNQKITFGSGANMTQVSYEPAVVANLNVPAGTRKPTNFGTFRVKKGTVGGAAVPRPIRFEINVYMTVPYAASRTIRGYILPEVAPNVPKIIFDSQTYDLRGSDFVLDFTSNALSPDYSPWATTLAAGKGPAIMCLSPFDALCTDTLGDQRIGYLTMPNASTAANGATNIVQGTISPPEPARIRVISTGYGPRGSRKTLEAIIQNNYFNGLGAPATLTMVGPPTASNGNFTFNPGNSNAMTYSGVDLAAGSTDIIPPVGVAHPPDCTANPCADPNLVTVQDGFGKKIGNTVVGNPENVSGEVPPWLASPAALDSTVKTLYDTAINSYDPNNTTGRVFTNTNPTTWGDNATGTGITFCDGDCSMGPISGGGILIVTGQLTLSGNFNWHGLIIVTGANGILRSGGGHGTIQGNIVVAPYLNSAITGGVDPLVNAGFLAPKWDTNGGGASDIQYNSDNQNSGLGAISNNVLGVVEK